MSGLAGRTVQERPEWQREGGRREAHAAGHVGERDAPRDSQVVWRRWARAGPVRPELGAWRVRGAACGAGVWRCSVVLSLSGDNLALAVNRRAVGAEAFS